MLKVQFVNEKLKSFFIFYLLFLSFNCESQIKMKRKPLHIYKPNPGIVVNLKIEYINKDSIVADITITNNSTSAVAFYKPLIGYPDTQERIFGMSDECKSQGVPYIGNHHEEYEGGNPGPAILIYPKEGKQYYLVLEKEETFKNKINLVHFYDFSKAKGRMIGLYTIFLPYVSPNNFKRIFEKDPKDPNKMKPVFFGINSGEYTEFEIN